MVDKQLGKGLADFFLVVGGSFVQNMAMANGRWQTAEGKGKLLLKSTSVRRVLD